MIVGTILLGAGGLLVMVGGSLAVAQAMNAPPRYKRPVRMDAEASLGSETRTANRLGVVLVFAGATLVLARAYLLASPN